jgi:hypothetical protein
MLLFLLNLGAGGVTPAPFFPGERTAVIVTTEANKVVVTSDEQRATAIVTTGRSTVR